MRIAIDATYSVDPHPSGIAVYSRELLARLSAAHPEDSFLHCFRMKQFREAPPANGNIRKKLLLPPLPTFHADLFHALNQRVDRRPARKVIATFHDLFVMTAEYSTREFRQRFADQARRAAERSDLIITVSQFTADQVHSLLKVERERIRVIPHGVTPPASGTGAVRREKMILFVGAIQTRKNIERLCQAFESAPKDWSLVLAGSTGFGSAGILERIERSPARERISLPGYVRTSELENLYAKASLFAFPSLDEGFGMPVLDAMARGVPVITSNRSALPEVAGEAGLLVDPLDQNAIAEALNRLTGSEELRTELSLKGMARARLFSWDNATNATFSAYKELAYF